MSFFAALPGRRRAVIEVIFASMVWGLAFTAVKWCLLVLDPLWMCALRFTIASVAATPIIFSSRIFRPHATLAQFRLAAFPGLFLGAVLIVGCTGLQYTTVTKASFITVLYIVFVPLLEAVWLGRRGLLTHGFFVTVALVGMYLVCRPEAGDWNRGDLITLGCSILAAFHILALDLVATRITSSFVFNVFQTVWAGLFSLVLALCFGTMPHLPFPALTWVGLCILAFGATLFSFLAQVRGQRVLSASLVSLLSVLETPFAALFAYLAFGEILSLTQWSGAALILVATALATRLHLR